MTGHADRRVAPARILVREPVDHRQNFLHLVPDDVPPLAGHAIQEFPVLLVGHLLGHSDVKVTMRYAHTNRAAKARAVRSLAAAHSDKVVTERLRAGKW
jgi:hypothetical protein